MDNVTGVLQQSIGIDIVSNAFCTRSVAIDVNPASVGYTKIEGNAVGGCGTDNSIGYRLGANSYGSLTAEFPGPGTSPLVQDKSAGQCTVTQSFQTKYAYSTAAFDPSRFAAVRSITDSTTQAAVGTASFNVIEGRTSVRLGGLTGPTVTTGDCTSAVPSGADPVGSLYLCTGTGSNVGLWVTASTRLNVGSQVESRKSTTVPANLTASEA